MAAGTTAGAQLGLGCPAEVGAVSGRVLMRQEVWGCPGELGGLIVGGTLLKCCLFSAGM